jgi:hypothetical protein
LVDDPLALIATMAHELCHVLLLGAHRIDPEAEDLEQVTDLATVFFGLGVFTANATIREMHWREGRWSGWSIRGQGYLTQPLYGYALALFAWVRGEDNPAWAHHLRPDVRSPFRKGLRYLQETGDSAFR